MDRVPTKTSDSIETAFRMWTRRDQKNCVLDGSQMERATFGEEDFLPIEKYWDCLLISTLAATLLTVTDVQDV